MGGFYQEFHLTKHLSVLQIFSYATIPESWFYMKVVTYMKNRFCAKIKKNSKTLEML